MGFIEWVGGIFLVIVLFLTILTLLYGLSPKVGLTIYRFRSAENKLRKFSRLFQISKVECESCEKKFLPRWHDIGGGMTSESEYAECPHCNEVYERELNDD